MVALGLIVFAQVATRKMTQVPGGTQNLFEWLVEGLYGLLEGIIGRHLVERTFWFFATLFIFILAANWVGLVPGSARSAGGIRRRGVHDRSAVAPRGQCRPQHDAGDGAGVLRLLDRLGAPGNRTGRGGQGALCAEGRDDGFLEGPDGGRFFAAGCLEIVSILFRPVSLSFRLYGNVFAGESMLETMATLVPGLGWLLPIPFYFMELLVGLVQAMVFMLLTAVFTLLICQHDEAGHAATHG